MKSLKDLFIVAALGGALAWAAATMQPAPEPDACPDGKCPAPVAPTPVTPTPRPTPQPLPEPAKPKPSPRRPWGEESASVEASVGGYTTPDGKPAACPLPESYQRKNVGGSDGAGLCVFTSIGHAAEWQDVPQLKDFQSWMRSKPGGGYPSKVEEMVARKCREIGADVPRYLQVEGSDLEILRLACKTGRMPSVTYSVSPTGRYGGRRIAHMVSLVHADTSFGILDNNYIGSSNIEWLNESEFQRSYTGMGGGWSVILLDYPPPPIGTPAQESEFLAEACPNCVASPLAVAPQPAVVAHNWRETSDKNQVALFLDGQQHGIYRRDLRGYYRLNSSGSWVAEALPRDVKCPDCKCPDCNCDPCHCDGIAFAENHGIDLDKWQGSKATKPRYRLNGVEVSREAAYKLVEGDLQDDSAHPWIVMVGDKALRGRALEAIKSHPEMAGVAARVKSYDPGNWHVPFRKLKTGCTVLKADGTELCYCDNLGDLEGLLDAILVALGKRQPKPAPTPDNPSPGPAIPVESPTIPCIVVAVLLWLINRRKEQK